MAIPCNFCGSNDSEQVRSKDRTGQYLRSVICRRCGLVWTDPRLSPDEVRQFYRLQYRREYKGSYDPKPRHRYRNAQVAVERVKRLLPLIPSNARVFDVGAGSGEVVYVLRALGCDASGVEPNEAYARYASAALGVPVQPGFYQDADLPRRSMDVVTMFHTVEHLEDPLDAMRCARAWLRPSGLLVVEVPNVEAVCQQPHTQFHRGHLYHFNLPVLQAMVDRAGFAVVDTYVSEDGGNIAVAARNREAEGEGHPSTGLSGNYERVRDILRRHTAWSHALSRYPWVRPVRKLAARVAEQRAVWHTGSSRELLDASIRTVLGRHASGAVADVRTG